MRYTIWNNKGGVGKTSLAFQILVTYALKNPDKKILAIDLCPQSNLSELLLGGLLGHGCSNLQSLYNRKERCSIGGYFQFRISTPFSFTKISVGNYISQPHVFNNNIPSNVHLLAGDQLLELQNIALTSLANTQLPGVLTRICILNFINDFIKATEEAYDTIFIDTNPSFSIYTQIALMASERLLLPIMADESSHRAINNVFTLVYGIGVPDPIYNNYLFSTTLLNSGRAYPQIHLILKNRITQYMGDATAYGQVLNNIVRDIRSLRNQHPQHFTNDFDVISVKDFGTTGVISFAEGASFYQLKSGKHSLNGRDITVNPRMLDDCVDIINDIVRKL